MNKLCSNKIFTSVSSVAVLKACAKSILSKDMKFKHGAIICYIDKKGNVKIISSGYNKKGKYITFKGIRNRKEIKVPVFYNQSIHAEIDCIRNLKNKLNHRGRLYLNGKVLMMLVIRFTNGKICNSKPCEKCMEQIRNLNKDLPLLKAVYYSDKDGLIRRMVFDNNIIF